eukprot:15736872-Heterocapsa_arctica.AAC.1
MSLGTLISCLVATNIGTIAIIYIFDFVRNHIEELEVERRQKWYWMQMFDDSEIEKVDMWNRIRVVMRQLEMNENDFNNIVREYPNLDDEPDSEYTNSNSDTTASQGSDIIDD